MIGSKGSKVSFEHRRMSKNLKKYPCFIDSTKVKRETERIRIHPYQRITNPCRNWWEKGLSFESRSRRIVWLIPKCVCVCVCVSVCVCVCLFSCVVFCRACFFFACLAIAVTKSHTPWPWLSLAPIGSDWRRLAAIERSEFGLENRARAGTTAPSAGDPKAPASAGTRRRLAPSLAGRSDGCSAWLLRPRPVDQPVAHRAADPPQDRPTGGLGRRAELPSQHLPPTHPITLCSHHPPHCRHPVHCGWGPTSLRNCPPTP